MEKIGKNFKKNSKCSEFESLTERIDNAMYVLKNAGIFFFENKCFFIYIFQLWIIRIENTSFKRTYRILLPTSSKILQFLYKRNHTIANH